MNHSLMAQVMDSNKAKEITRNFLSQNYSVIDVRNPTLEDHTWMVEADVTLFSTHQIKRVVINAETGRILSCESRPNPKADSL